MGKKFIKMKIALRISFVFTAFLMTSTTIANAQFRYGGMIGGNISTFVGKEQSLLEDSMYNYSDKWGVHIGMNTEIVLSDKFCVAPAVVLSTKGTTDAHDKEIGLSLNYLEVPVLFQYQVLKGFSLAAGPYGGYLIGAKTHDHNIDKKITKDTQRFDSGLYFKGIYRMSNGFGFHAYYSKGFIDVHYPEGYDGPDRFNAVGGFGVSYLLVMK
jgi:hypothetical protein